MIALAVAGCMDLPQPFRHQGAGPELARPVFDDAPADQAPIVAPRRPTARITEFTGLPGDGSQSLRRALKGALERRGVLVVGSGGDVVIGLKWQVKNESSNSGQLIVTWGVLGADGADLGQVKQQGPVSLSAIKGEWGRLARDVAEGGADGIAQIVETTFTKGRGD